MNLVKSLILIVLTLNLTLAGVKADAAQTVDLPDNLQPFALAEVDRFRSSDVVDYRLFLGAVVKINRQIRAGRDMRLQGQLQQITWEIPRSHAPEEAFIDLRQQLVNSGGQILFECIGRECGASNIWANDLFGYATLYGRDDSQRYLAAQLNGNHYALYAVRRGNQRVYLHLDLLTNDRETDQAWYAPLETQGYTLLPHWPDAPELAIEQLADWMQKNEVKVRLVVHQAGLDVQLSRERSERLASLLRDGLIEAGIDARRLEAYGVGNLVPSVLGARQQVAVVTLY